MGKSLSDKLDEILDKVKNNNQLLFDKPHLNREDSRKAILEAVIYEIDLATVHGSCKHDILLRIV